MKTIDETTSTIIKSIELSELWLLCKKNWFHSSSQNCNTRIKHKMYQKKNCAVSHVNITYIMISLTFTKLRSLEQLLKLCTKRAREKKRSMQTTEYKRRCLMIWMRKKKSMESKSTKATKKNYDSIISMVRVLEVWWWIAIFRKWIVMKRLEIIVSFWTKINALLFRFNFFLSLSLLFLSMNIFFLSIQFKTKFLKVIVRTMHINCAKNEN